MYYYDCGGGARENSVRVAEGMRMNGKNENPLCLNVTLNRLSVIVCHRSTCAYIRQQISSSTDTYKLFITWTTESRKVVF